MQILRCVYLQHCPLAYPFTDPHLVRTFARKRFNCKYPCLKREVEALSVSCLAHREHMVRRWHKTSLRNQIPVAHQYLLIQQV